LFESYIARVGNNEAIKINRRSLASIFDLRYYTPHGWHALAPTPTDRRRRERPSAAATKTSDSARLYNDRRATRTRFD
jgi:hypothetical protein